MKNIKYKILYLIPFILLAYDNLQAQPYRDIYWIHGFAGNNSAWFPVTRAVSEIGLVNDFLARQASIHRTPYTSPGNSVGVINLASAASALQQEMFNVRGNTTGSVSDAIAIAHSQGGLVTRWAADRVIPAVGGTNARYFGGLVTFGSPHLGARISNARNLNANGIGELDIFLNQACNKLGGGILEKTISTQFGWFANSFGVTNLVRDQVGAAKTSLCNALFSGSETSQLNTQSFLQRKILGTFAGVDGTRSVLDDPVLNDYSIGAPALGTLNNMSLTPNIKRVNFYGSELDNGIFFRTIHYFFNQSAAHDPFQATDADENVTVTQLQNVTRAGLANQALANRMEANATQCGNWWWWGITAVYCWIPEIEANTLRSEARAMEEAVRWIDGADDQWLGIIGAKQEVVRATGIQCVCDVGLSPYTAARSCTGRESSRGCEEFPTFRTVIERQDHDGVVVKSSAIGMPEAIQTTDVNIRMEGSQHMQMRNDERTKEKLNLLFGGSFGTYFKTERKQ